MKMAKASHADLEVANKIARVIEDLEKGYMPDDSDRESTEFFDPEDSEQCKRAIRAILDTAEGGSMFRVTFGMVVVLDPRNKVVDPDADTLELHPDHHQNAADAERWRWATALDDNAEILHSIVLSYGGDQAKINARADSYRDAMAQQRQEGK